MSLRLNDASAPLGALRHLSAVTGRIEDRHRRLSSGLRIATGADDGAGLGVSERLRARARSFGAAARNIEDGISLVQVAEGALASVTDTLHRMRELVQRGMTGTLSAEDRDLLTRELRAGTAELRRVVESTEFRGSPLFTSDAPIEIQVGDDAGDTIGLRSTDLRAMGASLAELALDSAEAASNAAVLIDRATGFLASLRGRIAAQHARLRSTLRSAHATRDTLSIAGGRIRDIDLAEETALLTKDRILQVTSLAAMAQATLQNDLALSLL